MNNYNFTIKFGIDLSKRMKRRMWGKNISNTKANKRKNVGILEKIAKSVNPKEKTSF